MYKVVIIGAGNIGAMFDRPEDKKILTHAHGFSKSPYFQLKGFYDVDKDKACTAAERWNTQVFTDLEEAARAADVACCCVSDRYHYSVLKELSHYPLKLVIAEKPLAQTLKETEELQKAYQEIPCMVNYSRRFLREFQELKKEIPQYGRFLKGSGYYGKGLLHNGSHMIDLLCFLFGEIKGYEHPEYGIYDFWDDDISCDVKLRVGGGIFRMNAIDCNAATIFEMDLFFEKARVRVLDGGMRIERYMVQESPVFTGYYNYIRKTEEQVDYSNAIQEMVENAGRYLEYGESLKCCLEDGKRVLQWCLNIRGDLV